LQAGPFVGQSDIEGLLVAERALELRMYRSSHQARAGRGMGRVTGAAIASTHGHAAVLGFEGII
jgi:hypothetical protein